MIKTDSLSGAWTFSENQWKEDSPLLNGLGEQEPALFTQQNGRDTGWRFVDLNNNGCCKLVLGNSQVQGIWEWSKTEECWRKLPFSLPPNTKLVNAEGRDAGFRFVDLDGDNLLDIVYSNEERYAVYRLVSMQEGWSAPLVAGVRGDKNELPMISVNGANNGTWLRPTELFMQNEHTPGLRVSFKELLTVPAEKK